MAPNKAKRFESKVAGILARSASAGRQDRGISKRAQARAPPVSLDLDGFGGEPPRIFLVLRMRRA
jgi:hypothetical protein